MSAPSFTIIKTARLSCTPTEIATYLFSLSPASIRDLTLSSPLAHPASYAHISTTATHVPEPSEFSLPFTDPQTYVPATDPEHPQNATSVRINFTEHIPLLFGLFTAKPKLDATWTFEGAEEEGGERRVAVYKSGSEGHGVRVVKRRMVKEWGEAGAEVCEDLSVWCPWGLGWVSKGITDAAVEGWVRGLEEKFGKFDGEKED